MKELLSDKLKEIIGILFKGAHYMIKPEILTLNPGFTQVFTQSLILILIYPLMILILKKMFGKVPYKIVITGTIAFLTAIVLEGLILFFMAFIPFQPFQVIITNVSLFIPFKLLLVAFLEELFKYLPIKNYLERDYKEVVIFGVAFGATEAVVYGVNLAIMPIPFTGLIPMLIIPFLTRLVAVALHLGLSLINFKAVTTQRIRYFILAVILHMLINSAAKIFL